MLKKEKKLFWIENVSFVFMAVTFLVMPVRIEIMKRITGVFFWISFLTGIVCQILLSKAVRKESGRQKEKRNLRPGLFYVAQNPIGLAADLLCAILIPASVVTMIITKQTGYICFIFIALLVFSFSMHCIWNGKNCEYLFGLGKIYRKKSERRRRGY